VLQLLGVDPLHIDLRTGLDSGVLERLPDGEIGILHGIGTLRAHGVLPHNGHLDTALCRIHPGHEFIPVSPLLQGKEPHGLHDVPGQPLRLHLQGHAVDVIGIVSAYDRLHRHIAEVGDLVLGLGQKGPLAAHHNHIRLQAQLAHLLDAVLGGLGLLLSVHRGGGKRHVNEEDVSRLLVLELAHGL